MASFDTGSLPAGASVYRSGTVGFAALGSTAQFRDLDVTAPGGATLYANALSASSALADFAGPDTATPDPLPVIMDGAKRDRVVWSGDLGVELPNVFYTTGGRQLRPGIAAAPGQLSGAPTASRARTSTPPRPGHLSRERDHLLGLVLDGRGGQHRHVLPLHRRPRLRPLAVAR